jgi:hypothetical protein
MFPFAQQKNYHPVMAYRDDKAATEELLTAEGRSSSNAIDDIPPYYNSPSRTQHRLSIALNVVLLCTILSLIIASWPDWVLKYGDKFNNGLLKRVSQPCTFSDIR